MPKKEEEVKEGTTITIDNQKINDLVKSKIEENFINLNEENTLWDTKYELDGLSEDLRKTIWSGVKNIKQIPKMEFLKDIIKQQKQIKGITETQREQITKANEKAKEILPK